jgi:hypothetical protein
MTAEEMLPDGPPYSPATHYDQVHPPPSAPTQGSNRMLNVPLAVPSGAVARRALSTLVEVRDEA